MEIILNIIFFILLVIGALYLIRIPVLKGKLCSSLRHWYELITPPEDLYDSLGETLIIPDEQNRDYSFEFSAKYIGLYGIQFITAEHLPSTYNPSDFALSLRIRFVSDHKAILGPLITEMQSPWWGIKEAGFTLFTFRVPEDAHLEENIKCEVQVVSTSYGYFTRGEKIKVCIKRLSEKTRV